VFFDRKLPGCKIKAPFADRVPSRLISLITLPIGG